MSIKELFAENIILLATISPVELFGDFNQIDFQTYNTPPIKQY